MTNVPGWDEHLQRMLAEAVRPLTEMTQAMVANAVLPTTEALNAMVKSALAPISDAATIVDQRNLTATLAPALESLQSAIRLSMPNMNLLGPDLARDFLQALEDTETIGRQAEVGALVEDVEDPAEGGQGRRETVEQVRQRIAATLAQLVTLEARVRARATEVNDGLDAYLGLISKAVVTLTVVYTWLDKLI